MLARMVNAVNRQLRKESEGALEPTVPGAGNRRDAHGTLESRVTQRELIRARVQRLAESGSTRLALLGTRSGGVRKARSATYTEGEGFKPQPNWKDHPGVLKDSPVNSRLVDGRKHGHGRLVVKESLIPGDTGWGLCLRQKGDQCRSRLQLL